MLTSCHPGARLSFARPTHLCFSHTKATSALREVLSVDEVEELVASRYAELAYTLLTRVGGCADVKASNVSAHC